MSTPGEVFSRVIDSPLGDLVALATMQALVRLEFAPHSPEVAAAPQPRPRSLPAEILDQAASELREYFTGRRREFTLAVIQEGTEFRQRVWRELCLVPFAQTVSYSDLARRVGSAEGFRAVGAANGANGVPIIVPCHRVINSDGGLGGYSGDLWRKRWLLEHERRVAGMPPLDLFAVKSPVAAPRT
jgi:methylated-DNA-[protein]-cysteine S-methyltransferase